MSPEWIATGVAILGLLGAIMGVMWRFTQSVDRISFVIAQIDQTIKTHWDKIDEHSESINDHGVRLATVETRIDYHEKGSHK